MGKYLKSWWHWFLWMALVSMDGIGFYGWHWFLWMALVSMDALFCNKFVR
jgi:hypothetical protein